MDQTVKKNSHRTRGEKWHIWRVGRHSKWRRGPGSGGQRAPSHALQRLRLIRPQPPVAVEHRPELRPRHQPRGGGGRRRVDAEALQVRRRDVPAATARPDGRPWGGGGPP